MKRALILALVMMLVGSYVSMATTAEFPPWVCAGTAPTSGGYGEAVVGAGQNIFLLKCLYATSPPELYRYSATSSTWFTENTATLPTGTTFRNGTALAWDGADSIYALAGARYEDTSQTVFLQYQVEGSTWSTLPNTPFSQGAGDALTWSGYDSSLYAFVGSAKHNGGRAYFLRYDPVASTWSRLPFLWSSTEDGAALAWTGGEYLYALRGEYNETVPNGDFARFHIPSQTWEQLASLPTVEGVGDGGSLLWIGEQLPQYQDYIFALSGGTALEDPGYGFYRYTVSLGEWESLEDIPCPVGYYVGNRLAYAAGSLYYWQGSPKSARWICGGIAFCEIPLSSSDPKPLVTPPDTARIVALEDQVRKLCDTIDDLRDDIEGLEDQVEELEDRVKELEDQPLPCIFELERVDAVDECISLRNTGSEAADLGGWTISDGEGNYTFPRGTIVQAGDTHEVCMDTYNPTKYTGYLYLNNQHDQVYLYDPSEVLCDEVTW